MYRPPTASSVFSTGFAAVGTRLRSSTLSTALRARTVSGRFGSTRYSGAPPVVAGGVRTRSRHAETTGRLDPAAAVRARADRRRKRRTAAVAGLGVAVAVALTAGIAIARPRHDEPVLVPAPWVSSLPPTLVVTPPVVSVPPPPAAELDQAPGLGQAQTGFDHRRAYRIVPANGPGQIGVLADGRVEVVDQGSVFTTATSAPGDDEWLIRLDEKGGSRCLSIRADGKIGTRKCDPSDPSQRLRYYQAGTTGPGRPAYVIGFGLNVVTRSGERFLGTTPADHHAQLAMVAEPRAQVADMWSFVDQGPSTLAR